MSSLWKCANDCYIKSCKKSQKYKSYAIQVYQARIIKHTKLTLKIILNKMDGRDRDEQATLISSTIVFKYVKSE